MKRTIVTAAAALLALAAFQGQGLALSDDAGAPGARGPAVWQPSGEPLAGRATLTGAPRMRAAVTYRDTIRPGEARYYGITLDGVSSAYASAFAVPPPGAPVTYGDGIEVELISADGTVCDRDDAALDDQGDPRPVGTAVSRTAGADSSCDGSGQYHLRVRRTTGSGGSDTTAWPLELRYVVEPPLRPGATPQPAPYLGSASPTPLTTGTVGRAQGGPSPETAAPVHTGIWQDQVLPGETRFYKVPVDWGQQATVFAEFGGVPKAGGSASSSYAGSGVRLRVYSPVRKFVTGDSHSYDGRLVRIGTQLAPVSYTNRDTPDAQVSAVRYAGWYYFAVSVHPKVAQVAGAGRPVALTLRIDVKGSVRPGPRYAGDPAKAGIGVSAHDVVGADGTPPTSSASAAAPSSSSGSPKLRLLAFGAFGAGTVLLAGLAAWTVLARRRTARAVGAGPSRG